AQPLGHHTANNPSRTAQHHFPCRLSSGRGGTVPPDLGPRLERLGKGFRTLVFWLKRLPAGNPPSITGRPRGAVASRFFWVFLRKSLAIVQSRVTISLVPLGDCFGDWATPKESTAGLFLRAQVLPLLSSPCQPASNSHPYHTARPHWTVLSHKYQ